MKDAFFHGYLAAALWSSTDDAGDPLDSRRDQSDVDPETLAKMRADCDAFVEQHSAALDYCGLAYDRAGFLFWLNRNGHGSGFWDEDNLSEDLRSRFSEASEAFGYYDLYIDDDGKIAGAL